MHVFSKLRWKPCSYVSWNKKFRIRAPQIVFVGAFHLTEIPEILLENQMEHVNFRTAVSKIPDNLLRFVHKLEIPEVSKFLHSIKTFPNQRCCFPKVF
jgi:hypothetical protein